MDTAKIIVSKKVIISTVTKGQKIKKAKLFDFEPVPEFMSEGRPGNAVPAMSEDVFA